MNIVFTGEGIISSIGNNKTQVLESLKEGRSGIGCVSYLSTIHKELPVGEVKLSNEDMKSMLGFSKNKEISRTVLMGIIAVKQALNEAGITKEVGKKYRIVLISGTSVGGMDITELKFNNISQSNDIEFLRTHDCGSSTKLIANYFDVFSDFTTLSTACSSAANAIIVGANMLKAGEADIVVAGGSEALTKFHLNGFNSLMILDKELCHPFDDKRNGLNLGEGAAFLVMESEQIASCRGVDSHAYLSGYGNACDAFHQTASSPNGQGAFLAMAEAITNAGLKSEEIQYVNAHGTGTLDNDKSESISLKRIFGNNIPIVSSTKSLTGHTTSASGSIEVVISLLALVNNFIPPNLGFSNPMPEGIVPVSKVKDVKLRHVLCNSFGFGGNDSSLVLSSIPTQNIDDNFPKINDDDIWEVARSEVNSIRDLEDVSKYVKPLEARRMGKLMKASLLTSMRVLEVAGIEKPDAIIMGTKYGCIENSEKILGQMIDEGEVLLKPTFFMQSTHNTVASNIAIRTQCHGYNVTYVQGETSFDWAIKDAICLLKGGRYKTILVGCHDESTPLSRLLFGRLGYKNIQEIHSISILLKCGK